MTLALVGMILGFTRPIFAAAALMATYPIMDMTPWSGQWIWRHHDFFALGICAGWLGNHHSLELSETSPRFVSRMSLAYVLWVTITAAIGYVWLSKHGDPGAIVQLSTDNAIRGAKGVWLAFLIIYCYPGGEPNQPSILVSMSRGAPLALCAIGLWCILERILFLGWGDWDVYFRIGGPMSGASNLGGQASELIILVMMIWSLIAWQKPMHRRANLLILVGITLGAISLVLMQTRSALAIMMLAGFALLCGRLIVSVGLRRRLLSFLAGLVGIAIIAVVVFSIPAIRTRLRGVTVDAGMRWDQYRVVLDMVPQFPGARWVGNGTGTLPTIFAVNAKSERVPGWFTSRVSVDDDSKRSLLIRGGRSGYLGWYVGQLGCYATKARLHLRSRQPSRIGVHLCEKNLTQSVACRNGLADTQSDGQWHWVDVKLSPRFLGAGQIAIGPLRIPRPLFLSLGTSSFGNDVEVKEIELWIDDEQMLWKTSSFGWGLAGAFMTTDDYFPFHIENDLLNLLIEQGIIGLFLWLALFLGACYQTIRRPAPHRVILGTLLLVIALFGTLNSPSDTPESFQLMMIPILVLAVPKPKEAEGQGEANANIEEPSS